MDGGIGKFSLLTWMGVGLSLATALAGAYLAIGIDRESYVGLVAAPYASGRVRAELNSGSIVVGSEWLNKRRIDPADISLPGLLRFEYFGTDAGFYVRGARVPLCAGWTLTILPGTLLVLASIFPAIRFSFFRRLIKWGGLVVMAMLTARVLRFVPATIQDRDFPWQGDMFERIKLLAMISAPIIFLFWWDWRHPDQRANLCRQCAYDLRGNVGGICPECGNPVERQGSKRWRGAPI